MPFNIKTERGNLCIYFWKYEDDSNKENTIFGEKYCSLKFEIYIVMSQLLLYKLTNCVI